MKSLLVSILACLPLLAADPAGAVPFYSELEAIDPFGLNDKHISHHFSAGPMTNAAANAPSRMIPLL